MVSCKETGGVSEASPYARQRPCARARPGQEDRTMKTARAALALLVPLSLGACAVAPPSGPSVLALPGKGKDLATFQAEDANCRNYAQAQIGGTPAGAANQAAVGSAAVGTGLGAATGALLGAAGGAAGVGAAVGA